MTQNVVTYTVVVTTENKDGRLYPYMTANVNFEIERHETCSRCPTRPCAGSRGPQQIAPDIRGETLAEINRHGDKLKTKQGQQGQGRRGRWPTRRRRYRPARWPASRLLPAIAPTGIKPEDWKARAELNAQQQAKQGKPTGAAQGSAKAKSDAAQSKKLAVLNTVRRAPPFPPRIWRRRRSITNPVACGSADGNYVRPIKVRPSPPTAR